MSLTNPKNVVTEERLSEFYGEILPYLGGMPEALANKFSKSDLYSTDEKIIGCWTDGKPIYQKSIVVTSNFTDAFTIDANLDSLVDIKCYRITSGGSKSLYPYVPYVDNIDSYTKYCFTGYVNSGQFFPQIGTNILATVLKLVYTFQYTKTTDAANSFKYGNETDYSTDEKIVGTWIDGKPIYQKTINFGNLPNTTSKLVNHNISNLSQIIDLKTMVYTGTSWITLSYISPGNLDSAVYCSVTPTQIKIETGADRSNWTAYATVQYTKTTD